MHPNKKHKTDDVKEEERCLSSFNTTTALNRHVRMLNTRNDNRLPTFYPNSNHNKRKNKKMIKQKRTCFVFFILFSLFFIIFPTMYSITLYYGKERDSNNKSTVHWQHQVIHGFSESILYLEELDRKDRSGIDTNITQIYLLFMSNKVKKNDSSSPYWCLDCEQASRVIWNVFSEKVEASITSLKKKKNSNSHPTSRILLLEIRIGSVREWRNDLNPFKTEPEFFIDKIPSMLRWNGDGRSSSLLTERMCMDEGLLRTFFQIHKNINTEEPLQLPPSPPRTLLLRTRGYEDFYSTLNRITLEEEVSLVFIFFVSGLNQDNGRMWCPYCDIAHVPTEYFFNHSMDMEITDNKKGIHNLQRPPPMMIQAQVADDYDSWKNASNAFRMDPLFKVAGIPTLLLLRHSNKKNMSNDNNRTIIREYLESFQNLKALQTFFQLGNIT